MKRASIETENDRLRKELKQVKKENKSLVNKLAMSNSQQSKLKKELKKKDVPTIELSNEQLQSLSNQLKGIDIQNLLSD